MRPYGMGPRFVSLVVLFAFSSALLARSACAEPVADPEVPAPPGSPATHASRPRVPPAPIAPVAPAPLASGRIELRDVVWGGRHGEMKHAPVPFQDNRILEGATFYRAVHREDLARAYESRVTGKGVAMAVGIATMLVGGIVVGANQPQTHCDTPTSSNPFILPQPVCQTDDGGTGRAVGFAFIGLSSMIVLAGYVFDPEPVPPQERQRLIDVFNASLASSPPPTAEEAPVRPRRPAMSFAATPTVSTNGAGLSLGGRF